MTPFDRLPIYFGSSNEVLQKEEIVIASIITLTACSSYIRYLHLSMALLFCLAVTAAVTYGIFRIGCHWKNNFTLCNDAICDSSITKQ
jgi:hypothetical protein